MAKTKIKSEDFEQEKQGAKSNVNKDKQTKKKSNAQKAIPVLTVVIISLLVVLTCVLIAYYQVYKSNKQNANILEGVYTSSYYSMVDNVNNLAVDVSKYATLSTNQAKLKTINDMMGDCNYVLAGLSTLPINQENVVASTKFFNQVYGLCQSYATVLSSGKDLIPAQELMFDKIGLVVGEIKANLNEQNYGMYDTNFNFVDAGIFDKTGMNELSSSMGDMTNIEYPAMIFDGPFSTALETREVKGLGDKEISRDDAYEYLKNTVYSGRKAQIKFLRETDGDVATYDFEIVLEGKKVNAQVSKLGGLLITLSSYAEGGDPIMGGDKAQQIAENFVNNIGFESMKPVWLEIHENVAYINLAPVIDDVINYPDLVKVKVDLTGQDIIGVEALNYALNHTDRETEFSLGENEAESVLGFDYEIIKTSKAVIRLDSGKEICAYEFFVERIDGNYFYYIDANTKEIAKVMKLVSIKGVQKLI